jgi:hypothetical protein
MKYFLAILIVMIAVIGCGGGGGAGGGSNGGGTGSITDATRSAAIAKVEDKIEHLQSGGETKDQQNAQIAAFIKTLPEFSDANVGPDLSVWGRFKDGRFLVVSNNRDPIWDQPHTPSKVYTGPRAATDFVTKSKQARLFHSFGLGFDQQQGLIGTMKSYLTDAGYNIVPTQEGDARLSSLRGVSGDGFFYFNTHGGSFEISSTEKVYCVSSSTLRSDDNERMPDIKADLDSNKIVYMTCKNGETIHIGPIDVPDWDTRYAITSKFVTAYWSFAQNAVVFMNSCFSAYTKDPNGAQQFMFACKLKGAGAYLGWDGVVATPTSENAPQYFVDRMTAANKDNPESPDQRAFFCKDIVADMKKKGIVPGANGTDLVLSLRVAGADIGLRPSIEYLFMNEPSDTLYISGKFGLEPGTVSVDGTDAQVLVWTSDLIQARIPKKGAGSFGDVIVKTNGKESNKRPLTKWVTNFNYKATDAGSTFCQVVGKFVIRQDFGRRRDLPAGDAKLKDPVGIFISPESTCSFTAGGEERDNKGNLLLKWSGGGALVYTTDITTVPNGKFMGNGAYDPTTNEFAMAAICAGDLTITDKSGTQHILAGTGGMIVTPDLSSWVIPAYNGGKPLFTFTQMVPTPSPSADQQYRPAKK